MDASLPRRYVHPALLIILFLALWLSLSVPGEPHTGLGPRAAAAAAAGDSFDVILPVVQRRYPLVRLVAPVPQAGSRFGWDVAIDGNRAVVAELPAPSGPSSYDSSGAVHIFQKLNTGWTRRNTFTGNEPAGADLYGFSIALSSTTLVVGAPFADAFGQNRGAIYIYERNETDWVLARKLGGSHAGNGARFGFDVAVAGERIIAGAPGEGTSGAAYIFDRGTGAWNQSARLVPVDTTLPIEFGTAVTLAQGLAFAGAPGDQDACLLAEDDCGAVYAYANNGTWDQEAKLYAPSPVADMRFGSDLTASVNVLAVGHERPDLMTLPTFFRNGPNDWIFDENATSPQVMAGDGFGHRVAGEYGVWLLVSAPETERDGQAVGAFYIYYRPADSWVELNRVMPVNDSAVGSQFGASLALGTGQFAVGAYLDDRLGPDAGVAYLGFLADFANP